MDTVGQEHVSANLTFAAPAEQVFAVLTDPATHAAIDGTGWVQEAADRAPLTEAGQIFRMDMYHSGHPDGNYRVVNKVEVFDPPRAFGWLTGRRRATVSWSSAAGSGVTTWCRSARPRRRSRSPTTGRWCRSTSGTGGIHFRPFGPEHLTNSLRHLAGLAAPASRA